MKRHLLIMILLGSTILNSSAAERITVDQILDRRISAHGRRYFSKGKSPEWYGVSAVIREVETFPYCREIMLDYIESEMREKADLWPQVVPLYLQTGGAPKVVVELLPTFKNPQTVELAKLYLLIHGIPSGEFPRKIENTNTQLKASLELLDGVKGLHLSKKKAWPQIQLTVENISKVNVLFFHNKFSLRVFRSDGIALLENQNLPKKINELSVVVLKPGNRLVHNISTQPGSQTGIKSRHGGSGRWYAGRDMHMPEFWMFHGELVDVGLGHDKVPLAVQFVYNPDELLPRFSPEFLAKCQTFNAEKLAPYYFGPNQYIQQISFANDGVVASGMLKLDLTIPRHGTVKPIEIWTKKQPIDEFKWIWE